MKKGFTLIEILVSMTILVLTISIALFATIGSSGLIQRADSRSSITESGRTISDTIRQVVSNAAVGTVALPTTDDNGTATTMLAKTYASDKSQNVCHVIGRAQKNEVSGKTTFTHNTEGTYIAYWIVPLGDSLECPDNYDSTSVIFQNQLTSDKTNVTELKFSVGDYTCMTISPTCTGVKQELRYSYTIELSDKIVGQAQAAQQSSIQTVSSVPIGLVNQTTQMLTIDTKSMPDTFWGDFYSQPVVATGGVPPYTWEKISVDSPPPGLLFTNKGLFYGQVSYTSVTLPRAYTFTVRVTDKKGDSATRQLTINVTKTSLDIFNSTLPVGEAGTGKNYTYTLRTTGGTSGFHWTLSSGPAGLTINSLTGQLSWQNPAAGTYNFTAEVSDSSNPVQTATRTFHLIIANPPEV